jgi:hypothetical protein
MVIQTRVNILFMKGFLMRRILFMTGLLYAFLLIIFLHCEDNNPVSGNNAPAFSELIFRSSSKTYVAYASPDRMVRPDTVSMSFNYNSSKVTSIRVQATLDSQRTWISIGTIIPNSSNSGSFSWVPLKENTATINYFGRKNCCIRLSDSTLDSIEYLTSDTFSIIGTVSFVLLSPKGGESLGANDLIDILYNQNQDLSANISVCYSTSCSDPKSETCIWEQNFGTTEKLSQSQSLPIKCFKTSFVPKELADARSSVNLNDPFVILLADYGTGGGRIASGAITIK